MKSSLLAADEDLVETHEGMSTLNEAYYKVLKDTPDKNFLGTRAEITKEDGTKGYGEYIWKTRNDVHHIINSIAKYMYKNQLVPLNKYEGEGEFQMVGIYSRTREEWAIADLVCILSNYVTVALYDTLGEEATEFIVDQCKLGVIFCMADKIHKLVALKQKGKIASLKTIIYFDNLPEGTDCGDIKVISYNDAITEGAAIPEGDAPYGKERPITADTLQTVGYTSGTTGMPKGDKLSHRCFMA